MNEISTILNDVLTESAFHVIGGCTWLYLIYRSKVGKIKDLYSSFQPTLLTGCGTDINQMSVLFDGYTAESTKRPEEKRRKLESSNSTEQEKLLDQQQQQQPEVD